MLARIRFAVGTISSAGVFAVAAAVSGPASAASPWQIVHGPVFLSVGACFDSHHLHGIAAISARDAWAVGADQDEGKGGDGCPTNGTGFAQHWDGKQWRLVPVPA